MITQYLNRYAEPELQIAHQVTDRYKAVIVIPAYDEGESLFKLLQNLPEHSLAILIINSHPQAPVAAIQQNSHVIQTLQNFYKICWQYEYATLLRTQQAHILLIDKNQQLSQQTGVGHARKIGADIALQLIKDGKIASPWIHNTDADVILPADYTERSLAQNDKNVSALIYPFQHQPTPDLTVAMKLYECALHYYVDGLKFAGSPYAYHTIGSTIAIHAHAYAKVRGFPKRSAGEDFHILSKLAKVGNIITLKGHPILIAGRLSDRVPFGTGPTLKKIIDMDDPVNRYKFYNPATFHYLKAWLNLIKKLDVDDNIFEQITRIQQPAINVNLLYQALANLGIEAAFLHAQKHANNKTVLQKHLHIWFDGLKTLKFIHYLKDNGLESVSLQMISGYFKFILR